MGNGTTDMARILVAEDNDLVANTIQTMLRGGGHEVVLAVRADRAVRAFTMQPFDLVFCDLHMRGTNGLDLAHELRWLSPDTFLVLMTGGPRGTKDVAPVDAALLRSWRSAGRAQVIAKPFRREQVLGLVRDHAPQPPAQRDAPGRGGDT